MEEWKTIPGLSNYHISNNGRIKSDYIPKYIMENDKYVVNKNNIMNDFIKGTLHNGIREVTLIDDTYHRKTFKVAKLVLTAFVRPPKNNERIHYINGDKNDLNVSNLEWVSYNT